VRLFGLALAFAVIALGTVALAEPAGVIDPWGRASGDADSWFGPARDESTRDASRERMMQGELKDPWAPPSEAPAPFASERAIDVFPLERAGAPTATRSDEGIMNPWAPPVVAGEMPSLAAAPKSDVSRPTRTPWSEHFVEIVDPWKRMPEWAAADRVRLVVDPWAR
jgi:hypothetical protein